MVNRASSSDEPEQIKRISQDIERANNVWRSWCLSTGGTVIELNGDHGRLEVPSSALTDLSKISTQYSEAVGSPVSVGVGFKLSQADKASKAAKMQGGDRVLLYTAEVDKQLEQDKEEDKESAVELRPYVLKENPIQKSQPALAQGAGAGMTGASLTHAQAPTAPTAEGSEHTQGEVAANTIADAPPVPEGTHAAKDAADYEGLFHQLAEQGHSQDAGRPPMDPQQQQKLDQLRAGVIKTLQAVKGQDVEQLKQVSPQLYQSVVGMTQAMIQLAQQVFGDNQIQKAEELLDTVLGFHSELRKALPRNEAENEANAQHEAVLQDMVAEKGQTHMGAELPAEVKVGKQTRIGPLGNLKPQKWSQTSHNRTREADQANFLDSHPQASRGDDLNTLGLETDNAGFRIPNFRPRSVGESDWSFSHQPVKPGGVALPWRMYDGRSVVLEPGQSYVFGTNRGGGQVHYLLTPTGVQEVPDSNGDLSDRSTPEMVAHINQHTAQLRNSFDPNASQFGTDAIHPTIAASSAAKIPTAAEMRSAMGRSPAFKKNQDTPSANRPNVPGAEHVRKALDEVHAEVEHRYDHMTQKAKQQGLSEDDIDTSDHDLLPHDCARCQGFPIEQGEIGRCTSTASLLARRLGGGKVVGYAGDDTKTDGAIGEGPEGEGGHDFALIDNRYIADWWANSYYGHPDLWDTQNPEHQKHIAKLYGDPRNWNEVPPITKGELHDTELDPTKAPPNGKQMEKAWPKDAAENTANMQHEAVLHDVLEERGTPVKTRNLADELDTKVSQIQPPLPDARQDDYFRRIHGAIRSNRAKLAPERDMLATADPHFNNMVPEQPSSQHWSGDGSLAFGERGNEDRQADTRFWSAVDTVTGPQEAGPVDQSDIMLRSPIMRLKKAWPQDEHENLANTAAHPVMEDAILEQGGTKTPYGPHEAATAISRAVGKQGLDVRARSAQAQEGVDEASTWEEGNRNYESDLLRGVNAQRQLQGLPRTDSGVPLEPHNSWGVGASYPASPEAQRQAGQRPARNPNHGDGYNDHQFWATADVLSDPGVIEPAVVSNASQVPNKAEMQAALARSPIMKRNAIKKLNKALPRNEHENQANAAAHPVMEDALLEQGGKKEDHSDHSHLKISPGTIPSISEKIAGIRGSLYETGPSGNPLDWPWSYPGYVEAYQQETERASREDEVRDAHGDSGYPSPVEPNDVSGFAHRYPPKIQLQHPYIDDRHAEADHAFWNNVTNSLDYPNETVSNASQIPDKATMKSAMARSPIMSRAKQDMSKAALEAGKTGRHNVVLPPGSQIDSSGAGTKHGGQIKVLDPEKQTTKWRSVRAGIVMAPDGTPTSARNPSGSK